MPEPGTLPYDKRSATDSKGDVLPIQDVFPDDLVGNRYAGAPGHWDDFPLTRDPAPDDDHAAEQTPLTKRSQRERLQTVIELAGFVPQSPRELNLAVGLIENRDSPSGFARYLDEVLSHQQDSVSEDPEKALRKIMYEISDLISAARGDTTALELLLRDHLGSGSQLETVGTSIRTADWRTQPMTRRALDLIARQRRVQEQLEDDENKARIQLGRSEDDEIAAICKTMRRYEAISVAGAIISQQSARREFWVEALGASRMHHVARPLAIEALRRYDANE